MPSRVDIVLSAQGSAAVAKVFQDLADKGKLFADNVVNGGRRAEESLNSLGGTAKNVFEIFTGFTLANIGLQVADFARRSVNELTKLGFEAQRAEESFRRMTDLMGVNGEAMAENLKTASRGIVDLSDTMIASSKALAQGLNPEQITKLMEVAVAKATLAGTSVSEAFNSITTAVTNQQVKMLKSMGIVIDVTRVYNDYAAALGTVAGALTEEARSQALADEVIRKSASTQDALTKGVLTNAQEVEKAKASWKDLGETIGKVMADSDTAFIKGGARFIDWATSTKHWLDELGVSWNNYLAQSSLNFQTTGYGPGGTQNTRASIQMRTSPQELADLAAVDAGLGRIGKNAADAAPKILAVEHALAMADLAMKGFAAGQAQGTTTAAEFSAGIQTQIASLKALENQTPEVKAKIQDLQTQMVALNFSTAQQGLSASLQAATAHEAALLSLVKESVAQRNTTVEDGAVVEVQIHASALAEQRMDLAKFLAYAQLTETQRFQYTQQLRALDSQFEQAKSAERIAMWAREAAAVAQMLADRQEAAGLTNGPEASTRPLLDALDAWTKLGIAIDKVNQVARIDGDEQKRLADSIGLTRAALDDLSARFGDSSDDAEIMRLRLHGLLDEMTRLQTFRATAEDVAEAWSFVEQASSGATTALGDYSTALGLAEQESQLLGKSLGDELSVKIAVTEQAILKAAKAFGVESDAVKLLQERLAGFKVDQFVDDMSQIAATALLMGNRFDGAGAEISRFQKLLVDKLRETNNVITPEVADIASKLNGMIDANRLQQALGTARSVFDDLVDAGRGTASALNSGFSDLFFDLFTGQVKSLADVFASFGKSMLRVLADFLASAVVKQFLGFLGDLLGAFGDAGGGGWVNALSKAFGGTGAGGSGSGSLITAAFGGAAKILGSFGDSVSEVATTAVDALNGVAFGAETASKGLGSLIPVIGSVIGLGVGVYGLINSIQSGSASGIALSSVSTVLSGYGLASTLGLVPSIATMLGNALVAVAPQFAASLGAALGTTIGSGAAGTTAAVGVGAGLSAGLSAIAALAPFAAFAGLLVGGGFAGMAQDAEDGAIQTKENADKLRQAAGEVGVIVGLFQDIKSALSATNLPATLTKLGAAMRDLPNLQHAPSLGAEQITAMTTEWRAKVGALFLTALDAASKQGLDTSGILQSPFRVRVPNSNATAAVQPGQVSARGYASISELYGQGEGDWINALLDHVKQITDPLVRYLDTSNNVDTLDLDALNKFLDGEYLTTTLRNAVVDVGTMFGVSADQFAKAGLGRDVTAWNPDTQAFEPGQNWRMNPGDATGFEWSGIMPSVAAIAEVKQRLDAAGFEPGNYGKALEAFLLSVDANLVSNPAWKKFTDALAAGDASGDPDTITNAVNAAIIATMTPQKFYGAARALTDALTEQIKAQLTTRATTVDPDALKGIDAAIAALTDTIKAWSGLVQLFTTLPVEMAAIAGDLEGQTQAAIDAWQVTVASLTDSIADAQKAFDDAITGGNIIAIQQSAQALHDAAMARYQAELKMVQQITDAIQAILGQAETLVQMVTSIGQYDISASGSFGTIQALLDALQNTAEHASTTAARLWAVDQALKAIITTLPTAIAKFGPMQTAEQWLATGMQTAAQLQAGPNAISRKVVEGAAPFLAVQQTAIDAASGGTKLALLQQQAAAWNALATAAINGVNQWADQAIAGATAAAKVVTDGIDAQIVGIQEAAQVAADARAAEMEGLQEQIAKAREFAAAVKSMAQFIEQLRVGSLAPSNPMDQFIQAQATFNAALASFKAAPTAQGLGDLQGLAQSVLQAGGAVFTRPSPEYQRLFGSIVSELEDANALASAQASDSEVLQSQLDALQALDKTAAKAATDQIAALNAQKTAIAAALVTQTEAIRKAAADEIAGISEGLATALRDNAAEQAPLIADALAKQDALLAAVTRGAGSGLIDGVAFLAERAKDTVELLRGIYGALALAIPGAPALPGAATGLPYVPRTMPLMVHEGEGILTKAENRAYRSGGGGINLTINVTGGSDPAMTKAMILEAVPAIKRAVVNAIASGPEGKRLQESRR